MIHRTVLEWGRLALSDDPSRPDAIPAALADRWVSVARRSPFGGEEGGRILSHERRSLRAGQVVGVIAAEGGTLEILPKIDQLGDAGAPAGLRRELVHMLAVALDLEVSDGDLTALGWQNEHLLEVLIRLFCTKLFDAVRRGLPRRYVAHADDLPTLRGRLDATRQFTILAAAPQRLACRYDALSSDIALNQILKAAIDRLARLARAPDNQRRLRELALAFADVTAVPGTALRWDDAVIDRTNARWGELKRLARLLLRDRYQTSSRGAGEGYALLFEMNVLFEEYVARMLARAVAGGACTVRRQGGGRYCLTELDEAGAEGAGRFLTRPDIIVSRDGAHALIIDTKWKQLAPRIEDPKRGVSQGDVYQMLAYGRVYGCRQLMLLYPHHARLGPADGVMSHHRVAGGDETLRTATIELGRRQTILQRLRALVEEVDPTYRREADEVARSLPTS